MSPRTGLGVTPEIGYRLAALLDGEGCFRVSRRPNQASYFCECIVHMRADDRPFLQKMLEATELGRMWNGNKEAIGSTQPSVRWVISSPSDGARLAAILQEYPLWSKKGRDAEIWSEGVAAQAARNWPLMAVLAERLREVRRYSDSPIQDLQLDTQIEVAV